MHTLVTYHRSSAASLIGFVTSINFKYTIYINLEHYLNLRNTMRRRRDATKFVLAEQVLVVSRGTLSSVDLNRHAGLVVARGSEYLRFSQWADTVALDDSNYGAIDVLNN